MTTHFEIIKHWIDSCTTEEQLKTIDTFVTSKLVTDDKQRDDIIHYLKTTLTNRAWIRAKVIQRDYVETPLRMLVCDEQPTDNIQH